MDKAGPSHEGVPAGESSDESDSDMRAEDSYPHAMSLSNEEILEKEGVRVSVKTLDGQNIIQDAADDLFPNERESVRLPRQTSRQRKNGRISKRYKNWRPTKSFEKSARPLPQKPQGRTKKAMQPYKTTMDKLSKLLTQGELANCYMAVAILLMIIYHPECFVLWSFEKVSTVHSYSLKLKFHNQWVKMVLNPFLVVTRALLVAFMQPMGQYYFASLLEKGCAKGMGCFAFLEGGLVSEAMAYFLDCYGLLYDPEDHSLLEICQIVYSALKAKKMVAFGTKVKKKKDPLVHPHLPHIIYDHSLAVLDMFVATLHGEKVVLFLLRDPHNVELKGHLHPGEPLFRKLDETTRTRIKKYFPKKGKKGCTVVPAEAIKIRFDVIEVIDRWPPRPAVLDPIRTLFRWFKLDVAFREFRDTWKKFQLKAFPFETEEGDTQVVVQLSQLERRMGYPEGRFFPIRLCVRDLETQQVIASLPPRKVYQPTLTFRSKGVKKYQVEAQSVEEVPSGTFEVRVVSLRGVPEDEKLPSDVTCEAGQFAATVRDFFEQHPLDDEEEMDCKTFHSKFSENMF